MGIRLLHHRAAPAQPSADGPAGVPLPPVPAFALGASTARVPATLATALHHTAADLRRRLARRDKTAVRTPETPAWRLPADLARGYLALTLALLPWSRPARTVTVFVAAPAPVSARPDGSAPCRRLPGLQGPEPDGTP
ncbi:hypothetical protein [Streptomyces sp. S.PNR 29]|uniref:hypothetical protein n=1 Tax=Streptomyces sp. S.PNR 29 TaxID=2973805 RepID=UPI0025B01EAA|nr:hypothetical protein [Streptomyces sp. S.PNR 29]MDN0194870.1 hypothetical protein [Streptomyces sp. S.PNR 29]